MIFTDYGSAVEILGVHKYDDEIVIKRLDDSVLMCVHISELTADGGLADIHAEVDRTAGQRH